MSIRTLTIPIVTNTIGGGTVVSTTPMNGEVRQVIVGAGFGTAHASLGIVGIHASGTVVPTNVFFHGAGTVMFGPNAPAYGSQGKRYNTFPVVGGGNIRCILTGGGNRVSDTVQILYQDR